VALSRPTALHALAIFLAFLLLSLVAGELLYLWPGVAAPYILAALKRDRYSLAASVLALLYLALHDEYSNVWGDDFMSLLELAAIGMAALEVRKPLGAVAYAYAVAITLLPHTFYGYFFIMLTAAVASVVPTRWHPGLAFAAVDSVVILADTYDFMLMETTLIIAGAAGLIAMRSLPARLAFLPLLALGAAADQFVVDGWTTLSYPPTHHADYAIPLAVPIAAKALATAALLWDGRKKINELAGAAVVSLYLWLVPNPSGYVVYFLHSWPLIPLAPTAAAAYALHRARG
jgi:hypothetical protein